MDQPLSYAEFIVQSKSNAAAPPQREGPSKLLGTEDAGVTKRKQSETASVLSAPGGLENVQDCAKKTQGGSDGVKKDEATQETSTDQKEGNRQRSDPSLSLGPKPVGSGSSIIVSPRQVSSKMYHGLGNTKYRFVQEITDALFIYIHSLHIFISTHWEFKVLFCCYNFIIMGQQTLKLLIY